LPFTGGEIATVIGLSGAGIKHIIGLLERDEGTILFRGRPINEMRKIKRNAFLQWMSYMFEEEGLEMKHLWFCVLLIWILFGAGLAGCGGEGTEHFEWEHPFSAAGLALRPGASS
jgi:ABC-type uncharacterized transport system ATPase subunit